MIRDDDRRVLDIAGRLRAAATVACAGLPVVVVVAWLYGSQAAGRPRPDSDIDVGVLLDEVLPVVGHGAEASRCADALSAATSLAGIDVTVLAAIAQGRR